MVGSPSRKIPKKAAPSGSASPNVAAMDGDVFWIPFRRKVKAKPAVRIPRDKATRIPLIEVQAQEIGKMKQAGAKKTAFQASIEAVDISSGISLGIVALTVR